MVINKHHIQIPTEVITTTLDIPEDYKQLCIQEAYKIGDKQGQQTNVKAIMSSYRIWEETDVYNPLLDKIMDKINVASPLSDGRFKYTLHDCWSAIYKEGHYTIPHNHLPIQITSFVYYLKTNSTSSPLVFDGSDFHIYPHDDMLVIFPSHVWHSVPKHSGEDRICIAGNLEPIVK